MFMGRNTFVYYIPVIERFLKETVEETRKELERKSQWCQCR